MHQFTRILPYIRSYSTNNSFKKCHYDVLKLTRNCSNNDIRNSFLKLSKEHHPDRCTSPDSHREYIQIVEAYKVLSKPLSRREYDLGLTNNLTNSRYRNVGAYQDHIFWQNRDRNQDKHYESKPYYGIKGLKKVSNKWIVLCCLAFAAFGITIQVIAIRYSFTLNREEMSRRSREAAEIHRQVRERALVNGDAKQLEILEEKLGKYKP